MLHLFFWSAFMIPHEDLCNLPCMRAARGEGALFGWCLDVLTAQHNLRIIESGKALEIT